VEGELGIEAARRADCDLTLVQRVDDWRAVLWEGRPAFIAEALGFARATESGRRPRPPAGAPRPAALPDARSLAELRSLRGRLAIRVEAAHGTVASIGSGSGPAAREAGWRLDVVLGPGAIPAEPDARVELDAEQAEAIRQGRLHPLEALMSGQLRLEGDLGLILALQAIAWRAAQSADPRLATPRHLG